ncbi:DUF928 domain-containing protein [Candidatus Albibeggiatoa sp. nov. NOAA]|uniref:DUF928 domain-containing protein n=1 Tax=Candidatus Albibeggiatoa sp. nov. NOAA TaxID=3162724 RepID=UPI0033044CED|nr:DUF928 domain-containing protein [Thiotrichaceae bacterium]
MKTSVFFTILIGFTAFFTTPLFLSENIAVAETTQYEPPDVGKPTRRTGAGTRGKGDTIRLDVLAPTHTGHTSRSQPTLYWFISETEEVRILIQNMQPQSIDDANITLDTSITPTEAGVQTLSLAEHHFNLKPSSIYEWSISLAKSPKTVASGTIRWVQPDDALAKNIDAAEGKAEYDLFASNGYWYDTIHGVLEMISQDMSNEAYKADRTALLEQVKLPQLATVIK